MGLEGLKQHRIANHAVLDHFGHAGVNFADRQRAQGG